MGDSTLHAELSPSKRHRWAACPGSIREEARYPEPPEGKAAIDGTRTHALLEQTINRRYHQHPGIIDPSLRVGEEITDQYGSYIIDTDRATRVNVAMEYIHPRVNGHKPIAEQRVYPDGLVGRADMSGTVDCQIPNDDVYEIIDYKDGMGEVKAENNPQLEMYALGVLAGLDQKKLPKSFQLTVIQPKLALRGANPISTWNIPTKALLDRVPTIIAQAAATDDPNAPLVPGEDQCKWCRAKGACPAIASKVMQEMNIVSNLFGPVNEPADIAVQAAEKDPTKMDAEQLRQILEAAPLVRQLLEGVEAEVKRRLEAGQAVPGYKLVNGRGSRKWALPEEEIAKKLATMGLPKSAIYETKLISPAQAEKASWDKKGEMASLSKIQIERLNKEYVAMVMGKPVVAPESDSRPAVVRDASSLFGVVEAAPEKPVLSLFGNAPSLFGGLK